MSLLCTFCTFDYLIIIFKWILTVKNWQTKHRDATYVGVPAYIAEGWHELGGDRWRFMVMERFGEDLEMIFTQHGRMFSLATVCTVAITLVS